MYPRVMSNPICFAADFPTLWEAGEFIAKNELYNHIGAVKVGLELFINAGPQAIDTFSRPVILDLKLHDIPETVARAVAAGGNHGAKFMTLHIQQRATIEAALKAAEPYGITLLGVTVLTSMTEQDCRDLRMVGSYEGPSHTPVYDPSDRVQALATAAYNWGLRGFVCSPQEVSDLKESFPDAFFLVPGVRPLGSDQGDQRRTGTPGGAVIDGANLIVIGRPIRDAADPAQAARAILSEVEEAQRIERTAGEGMRMIAR